MNLRLKGSALWKYINDGDCDYFMIYQMKIRTLLGLLLRNSIKHNWLKPISCVNHGIDDP